MPLNNGSLSPRHRKLCRHKEITLKALGWPELCLISSFVRLFGNDSAWMKCKILSCKWFEPRGMSSLSCVIVLLIPHERVFCDTFSVAVFICSCKREHLPKFRDKCICLKNWRTRFYVAEKSCVNAKVCSCAWLDTENLTSTPCSSTHDQDGGVHANLVLKVISFLPRNREDPGHEVAPTRTRLDHASCLPLQPKVISEHFYRV